MGPGHYFGICSIGMGASIAHTMTEKDIEEFARISSDVNAVPQLDEAHAARQRHDSRRLVHLGGIRHPVAWGPDVSTFRKRSTSKRRWMLATK